MSESPERDDQAAADADATEVEAEVEVLDGEAPGEQAEVEPEDEQAEVEPEQAGPAESELDVARRERDEYLEMAQRARAELENYRRRTSAEAASAEQRGRASVARGLLPALDNLERALLAAGVDPEGDSPGEEPPSQEVSAHSALAEGIALVYRELCGGLRQAGVESFDPTGEQFDPASCEAVATGQSDGAEKGAVIEVVEKGYRVGEQVLRPARVVVSG